MPTNRNSGGNLVVAEGGVADSLVRGSFSESSEPKFRVFAGLCPVGGAAGETLLLQKSEL